jgi:sodium/potassium/calcium exchanger 6
VTYHHLFRGKKREIAKEHNVEVANSPSILAPRVVEYQNAFASRKLLDAGDTDNCSLPREPHPGYNDSCSYVLDQCSGEASLINYLSFVLCDLHSVQVLGYVFLALWLLLLISLLATTADYYFVPPLEYLSDKLRLPPDISGITLLAIGNGAPDVFTAFSALQKQSDMALLLGALIGASIFISTVVFGSVIIMSPVNKNTINVQSFVRDLSVYIVVVIAVVAVAFDGTVYLIEALMFLFLYLLYIVIVVVLVYVGPWVKKKIKRVRRKRRAANPGEEENLLSVSESIAEKSEPSDTNVQAEGKEDDKEEDEKDGKKRLELVGLTWPRKSHIGVKIQFIIEYPFSILRWLTCPPCYHDEKWDIFRKIFASVFPIPSLMLFIIAFWGWDGFSVYMGKLPLYAFMLIIGGVATIALLILIPYKKPPHPILQFILGVCAFVFSIAWLNIQANEVVGTLEAFGLLFNIDTAILGLTVLAIGNSVGDWVADTAVARAGKPAMGVASCFGSPLLNDVLGLGIALTVSCHQNTTQSVVFRLGCFGCHWVQWNGHFSTASFVLCKEVFLLGE